MIPDKSSELSVPLLQDAILERLRERLVDGSLAPGAQINIREVAAGLGVSAVPVREAIKILQSEGRLVHDRGRGYSVRRLSNDEMLQVNRLSAIIEAELIGAGVLKLTADQGEEMLELCRYMAAGDGDSRALLEAHRRLHFIPFKAAGLNIFLDTATCLWDQYEHYRLLFFGSDLVLWSTSMDEHRQFADACKRGDLETALAVHQVHRANSFKQLARFAALKPEPK